MSCSIINMFEKGCPKCKVGGNTRSVDPEIEESACPACGHQGWHLHSCHLGLVIIAGEPIKFCVPLLVCANSDCRTISLLLRVRHTARCSVCKTYFDFATSPRASLACPKFPITSEEYREELKKLDNENMVKEKVTWLE